ncbi:unnamed protein product [Caenorhabditis angaria]|uniref:Uncharacterized protein n=1 Tax=Caenorhabditis angaria TaxID=860376 RepID=A0A9P1J5P8_9PELO|nr:unnamed protein product [Caenorhabditis angaria]
MFSTESALLNSEHSPIHVTRNRFKILVSGDEKSGKSSFIRRLSENAFSENEQVSKNLLNVVTRAIGGEIVRAELEEVDIQEFLTDDNSIRDWLDVRALILLYNSTSLKSFKVLKEEMPLIQRKLPPNSSITLVGTNADRKTERIVSWKISEEFAEEQGFSLFEISSRTGINCESVLEEVLDSIIEREFAEEETRDITEQPVYQSTVEPGRENDNERRFNLFCWVPKIPYFST